MTISLIHNGTLIDGNSGAPLPDVAILIEEKRICVVGCVREIRLPDVEIFALDARGEFILPGLIDTHVHVMGEG